MTTISKKPNAVQFKFGKKKTKNKKKDKKSQTLLKQKYQI